VAGWYSTIIVEAGPSSPREEWLGLVPLQFAGPVPAPKPQPLRHPFAA
jgi:hypothetical protein